MSASKKRPREDESRAECPFTVRIVDPKEKEQKAKKRRKQIDAGGAEEDPVKKVLEQLSPFAPTGKFKSHETMDYHYAVEPTKKWSEMTRYNSFVLNGIKYYSEGFVYVANESTVDRQKSNPEGDQIVAKSRSDDDWVARILEIRASDEHHVYARVYWMYWPDELPGGTLDGKKTIQGRQPYHGVNELVASNHMDIINVVSVTSQAQVNQMFEENDDDVHHTLYWRQAIDIRTFELSSLVPNCKCGQPGNPDKVLVGCPRPGCNKWLHDECLKHDALMKVYDRLGKDKPHVIAEKKESTEAKRPLSPSESGTAVSAKPSIDVKSDPESAASGEKKEDVAKPKPEAEAVLPTPQSTTTASTVKADEPAVESGKGKKPAKKNSTWPSDPKSRPYEGLFSALPRLDLTPNVMEITDLRQGIVGGEAKWMEPLVCLCCGHEMV